jgi:hypothetical protein
VRKQRKNPVPPSSVLQEDMAFNLYKKFTGHTKREKVVIDKPVIPDALLFVGMVNAIEYDTVRDGVEEKYRHRFSKKDRPALCSTYDGKMLYLLGGAYNFTERGIVDASDKS